MAIPPRRRSLESEEAGRDVALMFILFFRELIVDFLAILVPGFWFMAASIPAFFLPLSWLFVLCEDDTRPGFSRELKALAEPMSIFHTELFISMTVVSYLIGHLMFRQDPKRPDQLSWIKSNIDKSDPSGWSRACRWLQRTAGFDVKFLIRSDTIQILADGSQENEFDGMVRPHLDEDENKKMGLPKAGEKLPAKLLEKYLSDIHVEFPYTHLKDYLVQRGFDDLADSIRWTAADKNSYGYRSKHFINNLKSELEFHYPQKIRELTRIESHIRLHSSLWYACFYLRYISIIGILMGILSSWMLWHRFQGLDFVMVFLPSMVFVTSFIFQGFIENAFHYQRTREVFYVLKFAQLAKEMGHLPPD